MNIKNKFDVNTIKCKMWIYFTIFAICIVVLIWSLQIFFLETYYEEMKSAETTNIASNLIFAYNNNPETFSYKLNQVLNDNDIYIKVQSSNVSMFFSAEHSIKTPSYLHSMDVTLLEEELRNSGTNQISTVVTTANNNKTFALACYLEKNEYTETIMYLFSPLSPVASTVSILQSQLFYITLITIFTAALMSILLANKISRPIKDITTSAIEMGRGNYNIKFRGGEFTEISELASTLNLASTELEKTSMYQKDLMANVSHDLKTPLTMIKSYAELIRDISGSNPERRDSHLQVIIDESDRLNALVSDMLNISLIQSREITIEKSEFDIVQTIKTLLQPFNLLEEEEGYTFKFNSPASLKVFGDEQKITQVLSNLMSNAIKYCGKDKVIIINVKKYRYKAYVEIVDHGSGIAADELPHVWEKYYKSSTHHVRPTQGSGLGLSIVKQILTLHRVEFGVNSKLGRGSTFWFELPFTKK